MSPRGERWQEFSVEVAMGLDAGRGGRAGSSGMHSLSKWPLEPRPQDNGRWIPGRKYSQAERGPSLSDLEACLRLVGEGRQSGAFGSRELLHTGVWRGGRGGVTHCCEATILRPGSLLDREALVTSHTLPSSCS